MLTWLLQKLQTRSSHPNPPASSPRAGGTHSLRYCGSVICKPSQFPCDATHVLLSFFTWLVHYLLADTSRYYHIAFTSYNLLFLESMLCYRRLSCYQQDGNRSAKSTFRVSHWFMFVIDYPNLVGWNCIS